MGQRLTRIYTRTGDDGSTGLGDGTRVDKDAARVEAIGTVDELNSFLGMVLCHPGAAPVEEVLTAVQHDLFDLGGELAMPGHCIVGAARVEWIEAQLDRFNAELPSLREFILPAGGPAASACHVARAVCRRAERRLVALGRFEFVSAATRQYVNRLSDLLFVLARHLARAEGGSEVFWQPRREPGE